MKRLCAFILALMLLLSATALASVNQSIDKTEVNAGDQVKVTVKLDEAITGACNLDYRIYFNGDLFEFNSAETVTATDGAADKISDIMYSSKAKSDSNGSYVSMVFLDLTDKGKTLNAGTMAVLVFDAKADVAENGAGAFKLVKKFAKGTMEAGELTGTSVEIAAESETLNVSVKPAPITVESVTLDKESAVMILGGDTLTLTVTVAPENAEDKTVTWSSSNEAVATVADGVVTAVGTGTAKITATAGEKSASCAVTVQRAANEGYTVELLEDATVGYGSEASVSIKVGVGSADERDTYNAADIKLSYDKDKLTYSGEAQIGDVRVSDNAEEGTIKLVRYGSNVNVGENIVTLKFTAKAAGAAKVQFVSAKVDESANAIANDAPEATKVNDYVTITVSGFNVNLGDHFTGDAATKPGEDYTFSAKDTEHYDYANVKASIGDTEIAVTDNGDGTYTISKDAITGDITITANVTGKKYNVAVDGTGKDDVTEAAEQAQYGIDYSFKINKQSGYTYTISVNDGEIAYTDNGDNSYTIAGSLITKDITIKVTKTDSGSITPPPAGTTVITITGASSDEVEGGLEQNATNGEDFTLKLNKDAAYTYTVKVGDTVIEANEDGTYTIPGSMINGTALTVTIEKHIATPSVEVVEYLKLKEAEGEESGKSMWLVLVSGKPVDGKVYSFDGNAMFTSEKYEGVYCYLMISEKTIEEVKVDAAAAIAQKDGSATAIAYEGDVNKTNVTDINDAQLVYDMYQAKYDAFTSSLTVENFLRADMDGSKSIAVKDAAEIVAKIHSEFTVEEQ